MHRSLALPLAALALGLAALFAGLPHQAQAQVAAQDLSGQESALRVFLDCGTWRCREDRIRQDITWVTWTREPQDAQLYILMTGQRAGGGFQYTLDFEGQGPLDGLSDRYLFTSSSTDVEEEVASALVQTVAQGLVRFAALSGFGDRLEITGIERALPTERELAQEVEEDPWDYWVFFLRGNAELEREDNETRDEFRFNASANRTTEAWKIDVGGNISFTRREVTFSSGGGFVDEREDWGTRVQVVKSLDPHWSVGFVTRGYKSVRFNRDFAFEFSPAIEWNYFPWSEAARQRFVVLYTIGYQYQDYEEVTVYDRLRETLLQHRLDMQFRVQEAWGNVRLGAEATQFLNFTDQFSVELDGNVDYRLIRGLGLNLGASYEIIRDQRFISGEGLSAEEILTSRRALATGSRLRMDVGISYRFGSIFNSIVNARFPGFGGGR